MDKPRQECEGQVALWPSLHPCPVCEVDRLALGHSLNSLVPPYDSLDLIRHLGSCGNDDPIGWWDESPEPF